MHAKIFFTFLFTSIFLNSTFANCNEPEPWGFFGHKLINRLAVFTLPPEMIPFYKKNIEFLTEHAVDPDMRRYASKHEAPRHFMDLDRYGKAPFDNLPRKWTDALAKFTDIYVVNDKKDTLQLFDYQKTIIDKKNIHFKGKKLKYLTGEDSISIDLFQFRKFYSQQIQSNFYEDEMLIPIDSLRRFFPVKNSFTIAFAKENLSQHGIVPYHLESMQARLTTAFQQKDVNKILRLSAEFGHYIGDAHVPLHTTENYNGQLTNQHGIHGFWESRIPELFSEDYDFWVGNATYIENINNFYWKTVLDSHQLVDSVLLIEKRLSQTFPSDQITCLEERMGKTVKTQCEAYAKAFSDRLQGQVEDRLRTAILAVGSAWFTAWADAGQPNLNELFESEVVKKTKDDEQLEKAANSGNSMLGRGEN
jgi:hypothetical protein